MNALQEGNNAHDETYIDHLRSVIDIRKCDIVYNRELRDFKEESYSLSLSVSITPSGFMLVLEVNDSCTVVKLDKHYNAISTLPLETEGCCVDSCYISNNNCFVAAVVLGFTPTLLFVDVHEEMSLRRSVSISKKTMSLTCHSDKLYVLDGDSVSLYSVDGEFIKTLCNGRNVTYCIAIAVSNDGSLIYILNYSELITINSSGNHLFTLEIHDFSQCHYPSCQRRLCVDDQGNVIILGDQKPPKSVLTKIIQVSPNGQKCYGSLFQFDSNMYNGTIVYDSDRCALMLAGDSFKTMTVLTLR
jgi:hypothetical protein